MPRPSSTSSSSSFLDEGRFPAGTVLADRYRILGLLGRGGMGEVYRANDLKLGQLVAIKFLPEPLTDNERMLARFHAEVRIARQVSHPNVCRVYDIGEIEGAAYITMEYVDGEDLASLLRRIGRLPPDKALEIARKLCAGLAAAHDKGVLHRDLKPANVMVDGRGQVLITDFGLAGFAGQVEGAEIRNGTPAYMAPEQLSGREVSVRSDLYSLGLILYEMLSGKRAFEGPRDRGATPRLTALGSDVDPAIERVIQRCLSEEPGARPRSALAIAAALPGGDPLAVALAAGETPSPEMVAAAGETEGFRVRTLVLLLALILAALPPLVWLLGKVNLLQQLPLDKAPAVLAHLASENIRGFGYTNRPVDSAFGFQSDTDITAYAERHWKPDTIRRQINQDQPAYAYFWYLRSPRHLLPWQPGRIVSLGDPPFIFSGMIRYVADTQGRLVEFGVIPMQVQHPAAAPTPLPPDATLLFRAAGLDLARFTPVSPQWAPPSICDARAAWTGVWPDTQDVPLRVEAAWWRGKPVYFVTVGPWSAPRRMEEPVRTVGEIAQFAIVLCLALSVVATAALLAWRNYHAGRGDRRGAGRLFWLVVFCSLLYWAVTAKHMADFPEAESLAEALATALLAGCVFAVGYLALEPYVRRRWPQSLISWSRALAGGWRDPLVGSQVLAGIAVGMGLKIVETVGKYQFRLNNPWPRFGAQPLFILDAWGLTGYIASQVEYSLQYLLYFFLFFLLRVLLRREWLAAVCWTILNVAIVEAPGLTVSHLPYSILYFGLIPPILLRFGLLPLIVADLVGGLLSLVSTDFSAWYAGNTYIVLVLILAITAYAFRTALGGRKLFRDEPI
ncbi:MAG: serine/threonine-protein kinase [Bryobacteraceae bacterium]|jgi:serine/threonine-protein kinase